MRENINVDVIVNDFASQNAQRNPFLQQFIYFVLQVISKATMASMIDDDIGVDQRKIIKQNIFYF